MHRRAPQQRQHRVRVLLSATYMSYMSLFGHNKSFYLCNHQAPLVTKSPDPKHVFRCSWTSDRQHIQRSGTVEHGTGAGGLLGTVVRSMPHDRSPYR